MIRKNIKDRIKEYFFINPNEKLRVRHIEKKVKIPLPSAIRYSNELEKEGILKSTVVSGVKLYTADRSSETFILEKKLFNIKNLYTSGLVKYLIEEYQNPTVVVFGSYAKGEDVETSDIDLYIGTAKKINLDRFEKVLKRKLQIFTYKNINSISNKELANSIINGIVLNGFLEVL